MGWVAGLVAILLAAVVLSAVAIINALERLIFQIAWLRRELTAGLGVESSDVHGYASGGWLERIAKHYERNDAARRKAAYDYF